MSISRHNALICYVICLLAGIGIGVSVAEAGLIDKQQESFINRLQDLNLGFIHNQDTGKLMIIGSTTKTQVCDVVRQFPTIHVSTIIIRDLSNKTESPTFTCR